MKKQKIYDNYPFWIVFLSNLVSVLIYLISAYIIYKTGILWLIIYLMYILFLEIRLLKHACVNCYYFGKSCAFGKGRISCILFRKGTAEEFIHKKITWKDLIPEMMVFIIPCITAIVLLILNFNWLILILLILLFLLNFSGNALIRGNLACRHCKQREIGCPAEQLFSKKKKN
ncbi:hypothetical protein JXB41_00725 [Candidatus Woesearchaeota archaeon]|nr:hypothetical protein [Candidatus Woesearchaeota archaeon]